MAFGAEASELMVAVQIAMIGKMPYTTLREANFSKSWLPGFRQLCRGGF
jgi:hypothetical protein